ncbi:carbohydrate ABC transporter permease [Variovorax ginsengisoli]|uniref:Multiple sugar transport system permease protein n=1 Tax=Variovorax ginsengisoli TaxID=363844 RepID=A0ABT9S7G8_9BURK|nr:carbohydrate ABC transporter permease [Variovorax ginsengisoli]MDP9899287.1 multiple sugar transport system permease protein [Variovorax ginsengisoli]
MKNMSRHDRPGLRWLMRLQLLAVLCIVLLPIGWMVLSSFKHSVDVMRLPPVLLSSPTLDNYRELFGRTDFLHNTWNSLVVAIGSTLLGLVLAVPAAFAISWHRLTWPATLTLFARMAPGTLFLLPWFVLFSKLELVGSYTALILAHSAITVPVALWTLLPYFDGLPRALIESAQMDGLRPHGILLRIALPLVVPGVVVAAILCFVFTWNYFLFALALSGFDTKTAIVASFNFIGEGVTNWGALMAAASMIALPPLVLALLVQRRLVSGLAVGAVKG